MRERPEARVLGRYGRAIAPYYCHLCGTCGPTCPQGVDIATINRGVMYAREVIIHGPSRVCYDPEGKKCGVSVWVETDMPVELVD